jgi:RNA polymerase sigma-70 factor, ECF subfamily
MPDRPTPSNASPAELFERWGAEPARIPPLVQRVSSRVRRASDEASQAEIERCARHVWIRELYDDHGSGVFRYARSVTGSDADAEEVVQQTFLDADQKLDSYDRSMGRPRAWLFCFAVGRALNLTRSRRRRLRHEEPVGEAMPDRVTAPRDAQRLDIARALRTLDPAFHDVWWLCRVEEFTQAEVAESLGIPTGTVATRLRRADELLREALCDRDAPALLALPLALGAADTPPDPAIERGVHDLRKTVLDPTRHERIWRRIEETLRRDGPSRVVDSARTRALRAHGARFLSHGLTLALGLGVGLAASHRAPPRPAPIITQTARLSPPPPPVAPPLAPEPREAPAEVRIETRTSALPQGPQGAPRRVTRDTGDAEHRLRQARAALQRGDARDAMDALNAAERALSPGESREYLESLRIEALVLADERDEAQQRLVGFRAHYPQSAHLSRLEGWLARR